MDAQMDHGPIIAQEPFTIDSTDTYQSLHDKLADEACKLLIHILPRWFNKSIKLNAQDDTQATFTQLLTVQDARINWSDDANNILNNIRALNPEPGTWTTLDGNNVKILKGTIYKDTKVELPGKLYKHEGKLAVKCRDHSLVIEKLLPAGKNEMTGNDLLNGLKNLETKLFI
jgi:methionyl-tRNA formyltransferase